MDHSSLENTYLKETSLTSTKNKYLLQTSGYSEKYFPKILLSFNLEVTDRMNKRKSRDTNAITSTENKLLKKDPTFSKKKKKLKSSPRSISRKRLARSRSVSRSRSRDGMDSEVLCEKADVASSFDCPDFNERHAPAMMPNPPAGFSMPPAPVCPVPAADVFGSRSSVPRFGSANLFGSMPSGHGFGSANVFGSIPSPPGFGSMPWDFNSSPNTAGFSFGSAGIVPTSQQRMVKMRSALLKAPRFEQCVEILEMPVYNFESSEKFKMDSHPLFDRRDAQSNLLQLERIQSIKIKKMQLLNAASMALIFSSNLKNPDDSFRIFIQKCADDVLPVDPEFILKVFITSWLCQLSLGVPLSLK